MSSFLSGPSGKICVRILNPDHKCDKAFVIGIIIPSAQANINVLVTAQDILHNRIPGVMHQICCGSRKRKIIVLQNYK